mmetsp:Transcript_71685/g.155739  ORF Transcript_71685/g.155739 Transcript_71685/m.155739 type:complete len:83 (+) Transcript_71685:112-360(+)
MMHEAMTMVEALMGAEASMVGEASMTSEVTTVGEATTMRLGIRMQCIQREGGQECGPAAPKKDSMGLEEGSQAVLALAGVTT